MPSTLEYMQFSTNVYAASDVNKIGVPSGWTRIDWQPDTFTGFSAGVYKNDSTGELVISYTGTNDGVADPLNWSAGLGMPAPQIYQAMAYYFAFRSAYPSSNITFTGHSLGGGLASLMAVLFDKPATVFDAAPFGAAAANPALLASYGAAMANANYRDEALATYIEFLGLPLFSRASNVTQFYVDGEVLQYVRALSANISGFDISIPLANSTAGLVERHSMALMTALQLSDSFHQVVQNIPDLLSPDRDLLRTMLSHQLGVFGVADVIQPDDMLNRFSSDMNTLSQGQSSGTASSSPPSEMVLKSLIAFAMEKYYSETADTPNVQQQLFEAVTGGVQFDTTRINATITDAKGYQRYFTNYLNIDGVFTTEERDQIRSKITSLTDWSVGVDSSGMTASDSKNNGAFMLGGAGSDTLTGGTGNDLLVGGRGNDKLDGGSGNDTLLGGDGADKLIGGKGKDTLKGGAGRDTYVYKTGDGNDTIDDSDHKGVVNFDNIDLSTAYKGPKNGNVKKATEGGSYQSDDGKYTYDWGGAGSDLIVNGSLTLKNFKQGDLGITLWVKTPPPPPATPGASSAPGFTAAQSSPLMGDPLTLDLNGNGIETRPLATPPLLFDLNADGIKTSVGWIAPSDGLLVMDRNGNGVIDNGAELFGDATPQYDAAGNPTTTRTADGFAALAQEDINGDGLVNNLDTNFANLRVWQDLNQDGISQSNELTSLADAGIASINVRRLLLGGAANDVSYQLVERRVA